MSSQNEFVIPAENNGQFTLKIQSVFGFPDRTCYWGGYDTLSYVEVQTENYLAKGEIYISTGQIFEFFDQLHKCYKSLSGSAKLVSYEKNLELNIVFDQLGHVKIAGYLRAKMSEENQLIFNLSGDQSYLSETLSSLREIVNTYGDNFGNKQANEKIV
ncbi:MAG TPA: hypothetical protein VK772_16790 [Puia sp.]|jgi:hypothetical protein|nr:hypothetical protein [Puia sp.]